MGNTDILNFQESDFLDLFQEAGLADTPAPNYQRIEKIAERAAFENAVKESAAFFFKSSTSVGDALLSYTVAKVPKTDSDYKP